MRRGVGAGGKAALMKQQQMKQHYEDKGGEMEAMKLDGAIKICQEFKAQLAEFASKHRDKINKDAKFRNAFHDMCVNIGVDPLQQAGGKAGGSSTFWASDLGGVNFYSDLAVQILTVCMNTRALNGGLLHVDDCIKKLTKNSKSPTLEEADIIRAIDLLQKPFGPGVSVKKLVGRGTTNAAPGGAGGHSAAAPAPRGAKPGKSYIRVISSVPEELDVDQNLALNYASKNGGWFSKRTLSTELSWSSARTNRVAAFFVREGICWVDDGRAIRVSSTTKAPPETTYWFPSIALNDD